MGTVVKSASIPSQKESTTKKSGNTVLVDIANKLTGHLVLDEYSKAVFTKLYYYFMDIPKYLNLDKGLLILGDIGVGKTTAMRIFQQFTYALNLRNKFGLYSVRQICNSYSLEGIDGFNKYAENPVLNNYNVRVNNPYNLCIDELGIESDTNKYYGSEYSVIHELLLSRYDIFKEHKIVTHITTNLDTASIRDRYGDRIYSRMKEMFTIINYQGKDRRK